MPYILICADNITAGRSRVYHEGRDPDLIQYLYTLANPHSGSSGANLIEIDGGNPLLMLNGAEEKGYKVISTVVKGETIIWTLHK